MPQLQILVHQATGLMSRVFANSPEDCGSIPGRVIPKIQKMIQDAALLNKGKVEQSREWGKVLGSPSTKVANFTYYGLLSSHLIAVNRKENW